jgi:hypothetical protein
VCRWDWGVAHLGKLEQAGHLVCVRSPRVVLGEERRLRQQAGEERSQRLGPVEGACVHEGACGRKGRYVGRAEVDRHRPH